MVKNRKLSNASATAVASPPKAVVADGVSRARFAMELEELEKAFEVLSTELGRLVTDPARLIDPAIEEDLQKAIIRVIFATKVAGLNEATILHAFLAAWPYVADSSLQVSMKPKEYRAVRKRKRSG